MGDFELVSDESISKGGLPSIIESFGIYGLYGYKDVSLTSQYAATILIAKNGAGKTTLLAALCAFLRGQITRLRSLDFREIRCKLRGVEQEFVLHSETVTKFCDPPIDGDFVRFARRAEVDTLTLYSFIVEDFSLLRDKREVLQDHPLWMSLVKASGFNSREAIKICDGLQAAVWQAAPEVKQLVSSLKNALGDIDIVYLPTYRRIEMPLSEELEERTSRKKRPQIKLAGHATFSTEMQFGLGDIGERLAELNKNILIDSNQGYREISANIINELLDGTFDKFIGSTHYSIPSREDLDLFFSRIADGKHELIFNDFTIPNIDKIYSGRDVSDSSRTFLNYFLSKLTRVINATHEIELMVEDFIQSCNKYLSGLDFNERVEDMPSKNASFSLRDVKKLSLNRKNLEVSVESFNGGKPISLDALSSGEKQMISLFSKLFLYSKKKIVLIDEPELSLSLGWQREILLDILKAPLCLQIIAITHSPFVFDNELERYARSLQTVTYSPEGPHKPEVF